MLVANKYLIVKTKKQILITHWLESKSNKQTYYSKCTFNELNINEAYYLALQ